MITAEQIREARRLLGWAQWRLARKTFISVNRIVLAESAEGISQVLPETLTRIEAVLRAAGVEFAPADSNAPACVRLRTP